MSEAIFAGLDPDPLHVFFANIAEARDKRSSTHGLHPYPAKFIPHIPRSLITELSTPGQVVLDPMCGSGTTLVEASLAARPSIGLDLNPVAALASRAKTTVLSDVDAIELERLERILEGGVMPKVPAPEFKNRGHWFDDHVVEDLAGALALIRSAASEPARVTALCALSSIVVAVSRQAGETRWVARDKGVKSGEVAKKLRAKLGSARRRLQEYAKDARCSASVVRADARRLPIVDRSVDLVVTSPPYANSHDYYLYNKLRLFWLGFDVEPVQRAEIGSRNKHSDQQLGIEHYAENMTGVLSEVRRVMRPAAVAAVVVGDAVIRGVFHDMSRLYEDMAEAVGLRVSRRYAFRHKPFTSAFHATFGTGRSKQTHVLVLRRR
jgi:DNA modification methylase